MPLYFFNITQGNLPRPADEGMELQNDEAAWEEATTTCGEMIKELDGKLKAGPDWEMVVTNDAGHKLYLLRFSAEVYDQKNKDGVGPEPTIL
jgi:uncharacterized protein DUF6894